MGRVYQHVASLLREVSKGAVLTVEIGCGSKQYRPWVCGTYVGIDVAEYYPEGRADVSADARRLPLRDGSVDLVFMVATLFIMAGEEEALVEAGRVLRPGGSLLIFDYSWWKARHYRANR